MNCRFCGNLLNHVFVDLGKAPPSNSYLKKQDDPEEEYPLKVMVCDKCFLVQIDEFKKATDIFSEEYAYFSSYSKTWLEHSKEYCDMMCERFSLDKNSSIVELASNDGYLLQYFKEKEISVLGIEPTESTAKVAIEKGIKTLVEFFGVELAKRLVSEGIKADVLAGNNVLAHVPDINDFVCGQRIILSEKGVITMEFPHLLQLVKNNQFDTIYHEHFSYLSFLAVKAIYEKHGLEMFDVEELSTHGGSLRIYACHPGAHSVSERIQELIEKEKAEGMDTLKFYEGFQKITDRIKTDLLKFLSDNKNKKISAYGAAAKGNTLLNYCGITHKTVTFVVDASPFKQGLFMPGSRIPIVDEDMIKKEKPDFILILPWNLKDEIIKQLEYVREWDAKFVIAIPKMQVL